VEIESYLVELLQKEQADNAEFRDEVRKDFQAFREWMVVHEAQHRAGILVDEAKDATHKRYKVAAGAVVTIFLTVAGIIVPILLSR
jgi:hypothetical protein